MEDQTKISRNKVDEANQDPKPHIAVNKSLATKYQILEGEMRKLGESIKCCICTERKKNVMFLCSHGTCQYCGDEMVTCHICQKEITKKIQAF
ncbi:E3 ubiquitin-protein ligase MIB1 [Acropora cervicornis]|uniref:E3 ubiquitin-protein ligase MIB1 n=1 Tax=Acropora cervicornis TaxID=6130 RepID=A0AAD9V3N3_ACRCE|nr:E3 ubiquitin-protein ligase MIB1 [Acropora cervicornis]